MGGQQPFLAGFSGDIGSLLALGGQDFINTDIFSRGNATFPSGILGAQIGPVGLAAAQPSTFVLQPGANGINPPTTPNLNGPIAGVPVRFTGAVAPTFPALPPTLTGTAVAALQQAVNNGQITTQQANAALQDVQNGSISLGQLQASLQQLPPVTQQQFSFQPQATFRQRRGSTGLASLQNPINQFSLNGGLNLSRTQGVASFPQNRQVSGRFRPSAFSFNLAGGNVFNSGSTGMFSTPQFSNPALGNLSFNMAPTASTASFSMAMAPQTRAAPVAPNWMSGGNDWVRSMTGLSL